MATEVDKLVFSLLLDSSGFKKGEKTALGAIKNIRNAFISTNMLVAGFKVLGSVISDFKELNLQMGDLSRRTGNSTQALEKWTRAAKSMGRTGDQVLSDISRISTEFNTPEGRVSLMSKASRIGLPALEGRGAKDASDLLIRIAEASRNKFPKPEERAAALKTYMGLSDETIDVMLNFKDLRSSLADFQAVIDNESIDAAREMAKAQFEFTDSLKKAGFAVGKDSIPLFRKITQAFNAPSLENSAIAAEELATTGLNILTFGYWRKNRDKLLSAKDPLKGGFKRWWRPGKERSEEWAAALGTGLVKPDGHWDASPAEKELMERAFLSMVGFQSSAGMFLRGAVPRGAAVNPGLVAAGKGTRFPGKTLLTKDDYKFYLDHIKKNDKAVQEMLKKAGIKPPHRTAPKTVEYILPARTAPETVKAAKAAFQDSGLQVEKKIFPEMHWFSGLLQPLLTTASILGGSYLHRGVTVDSPQYNITINSSGDPAAIAGAVKSGVQQANSSLARTLAGGMANMAYDGPGLIQR